MKLMTSLFDLRKCSKLGITLAFLLAFHAVSAKSEVPQPIVHLNKPHLVKTNRHRSIKPEASASDSFIPPALILDLPEDQFNQTSVQNTNINAFVNTSNNQQLIADSKKKSAVNLNCGVDVFQNVSPETPLGNRLTGACDLKYQY